MIVAAGGGAEKGKGRAATTSGAVSKVPDAISGRGTKSGESAME